MEGWRRASRRRLAQRQEPGTAVESVRFCALLVPINILARARPADRAAARVAREEPGRALLLSLLLAGGCGSPALAPLHAQPPPPNRVLQLDGRGAYVELPAQVFDGLEECTVEGWVRWNSFRYWSRFFEVGRGSWEGFNVGQFGITPQLNTYFPSVPADVGVEQIHAPGILRLGEWGHVAMVIGGEQVTLHYNGQVVATGRLRGGLSSLPVKERFVLGRNNWGTFGAPGVVRPEEPSATQVPPDAPTQHEGGFEDLDGQIDEVRVWRVARSPEEIRGTLLARLSGSEPDLVALWNFDDGSVRDATARHHGEYRRGARAVEAPFPTIDPHARLQPVLHLDGFNSYAELPADMVRELKESTVEAWIRCDTLQPEGEGRFFELDGTAGRLRISTGGWGADAESAILFTIVGGPKGWTFHNAWAKNAIQPNHWFHLAAASGTQGMRFYLNGVLVASNTYSGSFASILPTGPVLLGKTADTNQPSWDRTFGGELTDVRVWNRPRTVEEIRRDMFRQLDG